MTVIVGWRNKQTAWIGGDSGAFDTEDFGAVSLTETKVWKADGYLLGAAGDFRLAEVAYNSAIGDPVKLRNHLEAWWKDMGQGEPGTNFLVVSTEGVWLIDSGFAVVRFRENYGATGAASLAAMSAMHALENFNLQGRERISLALKASAYHTTSARPPFKILSI